MTDRSGSAAGIQGRLIVDEGGPVEREDSSWPARPLRGRVLALLVGGATGSFAEVDSDADGYFRLELAPGHYEIRARNLAGTPVPRARPALVQVTAGNFTDMTIHFDSGIR